MFNCFYDIFVFRYFNIFVIVLSLENLKILFEFIFKGFDVLEY